MLESAKLSSKCTTLYQGQVYSQLGTKLAKLGVEENALENLIVLPRYEWVKQALNIKSSVHNGWNVAHAAYRSVRNKILGILERVGTGASSDAISSAELKALQNELRESIKNGTTVLCDLAEHESGLVVLSGIIFIAADSPLHKYAKDLDARRIKAEQLAQTFELERNYSSDWITFRGWFGKDSWTRYLDWINPLSIVQDGIDIAEAVNQPPDPQMPPEVRQLLEKAPFTKN